MPAVPDAASLETELKFAVGPDAMAALRGHSLMAEAEAPRRLTSIYFDTPSHALRHQGFSLRVRSDGEKWLQTIKRRRPATPFVRDEWEVEVGGAAPDLAAVAHTPLGQVLSEVEGELAPVIMTDVLRTLRMFRQQGGLVELSLDEGELISGKAREPIREVELELKSGEPWVLFGVARELSESAALRLCLESKSDRGYRLAGDDGLNALKAEHAEVPADATVADAFRLIVRSCLRHIANAAGFAGSHQSEAVHQTRVGVRRLRAAMSLFRDLVGVDSIQLLRHELKWLAGELTEARDLDVFFQAIFQAEDEADEEPAMTAFRRRVLEAQSSAHAKALESIQSSRFARLLLEIAAWAETGALEPGLSQKPVQDFAARILKRRLKTVRKSGDNLPELSAEERHILRINVKKLRYTAEFFVYSFGQSTKLSRKFAQRLRRLQDALGEMNDIEVSRGIAAGLVEGRSPEIAFVAGEAIGRRQGRQPALMNEAEEAFAKLSAAEPFWSFA